MQDGSVPEVPVFLNSPMAIEVTDVHLKHVGELKPEAAEFQAAMSRLIPTPTVAESKELNERRGPWIVIAGAGMLTGGRILHHLKSFGSDPRNALILPGFQAEGTRGRDLRRGAKTIKIHGQEVEIRCQIHVLDQLSAHADASELANWLLEGPEPRDGTVLVHAEPSPADTFRRTIEDRAGWGVKVAEEGVTYP
jgi:metallo-beta-lactamase family protein